MHFLDKRINVICDELKKLADEICKSVEEDGIYYSFKKMGLI